MRKKIQKMTRIIFANSDLRLSVFIEAALIATNCVQWSDVLGNVVYKSTEVQITVSAKYVLTVI